MNSPDENNVLPYLKAMGRLKDGVDAIEKSQLRSCDKTIYQMVSEHMHISSMKFLICRG
jgi:exocyst complex protein 7